MMKRFLLFIVCAVSLFSSANVKAQTFSTAADPADTVWATVGGSLNVFNYVTNLTGSTISMMWNVTATSFPADWLAEEVFGICDATACKQNLGGQLWNGTTGTSFPCTYPIGVGDFHLSLNLLHVTTAGTFWVTVKLKDNSFGGTTKLVTFVITRPPLAVANINNTENDITLYPNPAADEINVLYSPNADVRTIAVYNVIGKMMAVYKVTDNSSANLSLENMPSGIYFIRLLNAHGDLVVTRKFTKR